MRRTARIGMAVGILVSAQVSAQDPSFTPFGQGCGAGGFALPSLDGADGSLPTVDDRFSVLLKDLPFRTASEPGSVLVLLGFSSSQWLGFSLPLRLDSLGAPGCTWYVSGQQVFAQNYSGDTARWTIDIPNDPSLVGSHIFNQGVVFDPGANPLGLVTTNAAEGVIGLNRGPEAAIIFPPPQSLTEKESILVRGKASDQNGVAEVRVNGMLAMTSDGFANWEFNLPLSRGTTVISIETLDTLGFMRPEAVMALIESQAPMEFPEGIAFDPSSGIAFVTSRDGIISIDLNSGNRSVLSGRIRGSGEPLDSVSGVVLDGDRLLVTGRATGPAVIEVDLATGDRRKISDASTGSGPLFDTLWGIVRQGGEALVVVRDFDQPSNNFFGEIFGVNLASGTRRVIVSGNGGVGDRLIEPIGIAIEGGRALVTDEGRQTIFTVDLLNGNIGVLSGGFTGIGPPLANPIGIAVDGNRALVVDKAFAAIYSVDLVTGNRSLLSGETRGDGPEFMTPWAITKAGTGALVTDTGVQAVFSIDLATGNRALLSKSGAGVGSPLQGQTAVSLDQGQLLVLDGAAQAIVQIDRDTGDRRVISDRHHGTGLSMVSPTAFAVDGYLAYVVDEDLDAVIEVDLLTGNRRVISDDRIGRGQRLVWPVGIALSDSQALVIDKNLLALVSVDLLTGERVEVSGRLAGSGPKFLDPGAVVIDGNRAFIWDRDRRTSPLTARIVAVDLVTGIRTIHSSDQIGLGPTIPYAFQLSLVLKGDRVLLSNGVGILAIDTTTGDRSMIATIRPGSVGIPMDGIAVEDDRAILISKRLRAVTMVDLQTGEQVVLSK